ncbi:hypothetical protein ScPMuIL_002877 [Solemya velum]
MSSKLNSKPSRINRPRSSDKNKNKRRDGTPEKSGTPSQDAVQDENVASGKNFIWNEEIEKLQIKDDQLQMLRNPRPPSAEKKGQGVTSSFAVRKIKPASEWNKPKAKNFIVAKPAPPDADVKPVDDSGFAGPRYDMNGRVIAHSILGTYDEFHKEAVKRGDLLSMQPTREEAVRNNKDIYPNFYKRILRIWYRPMNQADHYRKMQEDRYLIDRTIPAMDYGKGYRVGSEFWKQQERFGDDELGIHMTLTQTEKGYPPPVEHVGIPQSIRMEKGWNWSAQHRPPIHYPWHEAPYLSQRKKQLQKLMNELDPQNPDFDGLEVIGTTNPSRDVVMEGRQSTTSVSEDSEKDEMMEEKILDPLHDHPDVHPPPIFGPSIQFAGQPARWTGDSTSFSDQIGIEARVTFESCTGDRVTSYLIIVNDGTTSVYYDWKKLPKDNPFDVAQSHVQRFYFNNSSGVILPGETMKFPFVFKSPNAGVFTEQWEFETRPVVCGGAALVVTLRGIAIQEDKYRQERQELERDLKYKEAEQVVRQLMYEILDGLQTPDRPPSPIDAYVTDEELFSRLNPQVNYNHECVEEIKKLVQDSFPNEISPEWVREMSLDDIKMKMLSIDEEDERKELLLSQLNSSITKMAFTHDQPTQPILYSIGYGMMLEAVDQIVLQSGMIRQITGMPEKDDDLAEDGGGGKRGKGAKDKKAEQANKDPKGIKKELTKPDLKGKSTPVPKKPQSRAASITPGAQQDRTMTPLESPNNSGDADPVIEKKYREKLHSQAYVTLSEMVDRMDGAFGEVLRNHSNQKPLRP